jgi:hypothetical protein
MASSNPLGVPSVEEFLASQQSNRVRELLASTRQAPAEREHETLLAAKLAQAGLFESESSSSGSEESSSGDEGGGGGGGGSVSAGVLGFDRSGSAARRAAGAPAVHFWGRGGESWRAGGSSGGAVMMSSGHLGGGGDWREPLVRSVSLAALGSAAGDGSAGSRGRAAPNAGTEPLVAVASEVEALRAEAIRLAQRKELYFTKVCEARAGEQAALALLEDARRAELQQKAREESMSHSLLAAHKEKARMLSDMSGERAELDRLRCTATEQRQRMLQAEAEARERQAALLREANDARAEAAREVQARRLLEAELRRKRHELREQEGHKVMLQRRAEQEQLLLLEQQQEQQRRVRLEQQQQVEQQLELRLEQEHRQELVRQQNHLQAQQQQQAQDFERERTALRQQQLQQHQDHNQRPPQHETDQLPPMPPGIPGQLQKSRSEMMFPVLLGIGATSKWWRAVGILRADHKKSLRAAWDRWFQWVPALPQKSLALGRSISASFDGGMPAQGRPRNRRASAESRIASLARRKTRPRASAVAENINDAWVRRRSPPEPPTSEDPWKPPLPPVEAPNAARRRTSSSASPYAPPPPPGAPPPEAFEKMYTVHFHGEAPEGLEFESNMESTLVLVAADVSVDGQLIKSGDVLCKLNGSMVTGLGYEQAVAAVEAASESGEFALTFTSAAASEQETRVEGGAAGSAASLTQLGVGANWQSDESSDGEEQIYAKAASEQRAREPAAVEPKPKTTRRQGSMFRNFLSKRSNDSAPKPQEVSRRRDSKAHKRTGAQHEQTSETASTTEAAEGEDQVGDLPQGMAMRERTGSQRKSIHTTGGKRVFWDDDGIMRFQTE